MSGPSLFLSCLLACFQGTAPAVPAAGGEALPAPETLKKLMWGEADLVPWIADPYRRFDLARSNRMRVRQPHTPRLDRGALLDHALALAKAEKRLVLVYGFRIEGRHMYRAPLVDDYMRLSLFADPELAALITRRFVPIRLFVDRKVGRRLGAWNADPKDPLFLKVVEPALFFVRPDGKVVHTIQRIRTFSVPWIRAQLRGVLRRNQVYGRPSARTEAARLAEDRKDPRARIFLAAERILDGDEDRALKDLDTVWEPLGKGRKTDPRLKRDLGWWREEILLLRMKALRLLRRPEEALMLRPEKPRRSADFSREAQRILAALGRWRKILDEAPPGESDGEAWWWRGVAHWRLWESDAAARAFRKALDSRIRPWAARAAAMLVRSDDTTPFSPLAHGYEVFRLGPPEIYAGLHGTSERGRPPGTNQERLEQVRRGLRFLLEHQRPDGSWADTRYAYWSSPVILPNVRQAITALAATALLSWRDLDPGSVDRALAKAEGFLLNERAGARGANEEVYSQAYRILYWIRRAKSLEGRARNRCVANLASLVKRAAEIQDPKSGFFAHEYRNAFCTGAMLWSLHKLREIGVDPPEDVVKLGVRALLSARRKDGSFSYGGSVRSRSGGSMTANLKNASARMPVVESVLHAFGASDPKKVAHAFEVFLEHLDRLARVRKCDFHSDGQLGGFFFWHAVFHASEAKEMLAPSLRRKVETALRNLVGSIAEIDGSFVDSHELGKSYGTAMALLTIQNLER